MLILSSGHVFAFDPSNKFSCDILFVFSVLFWCESSSFDIRFGMKWFGQRLSIVHKLLN